MKSYKYLLLLSLIFTLTACSSSDEVVERTPFGEEFFLGFGRTENLVDNIDINFFSVIGDSRCPRGMVCISEGEVTLLFDFIKDGKSLENFSLTLGFDQNNPDRQPQKEVQGYLIEMIQVNPYPESAVPMGQELYEAVLKISKL